MQYTPQTLTDRQTGIQRQSNIELLRIVAMVIIVAHHFAVHSGFDFSTDSITINRLWIQFIKIGGKIGVDVFVLISGFFLISSQAIKTSKILKLWGQIFFYSIAIFVVFIALGIEPFSIKETIKHLAPVTFSQWWFASTYFVLYILSPYINTLLRTFNNRQYIGFLVLILLCWCIIPTFTGQSFQSNDLLWFIFLYSLAGYYKLYKPQINLSASKLIALSFLCTILTFLSAVIFDILGTKISIFGTNATFFYDMQRLPILIVSVLLFIGFLKLNIRHNKIINIISSATFGVYLIHDNRYVRSFLWKTLFQNKSFADSNMLILHSIFVIAIVFIGCTIIELIRIYVLENNYMPAITRISERIDKKFKLISDRVMEKIEK